MIYGQYKGVALGMVGVAAICLSTGCQGHLITAGWQDSTRKESERGACLGRR
jgi:hypothetical protein